jgi:hypothetical protein
MSYSFIQAEKRQYPVAVLPYHGCSAQWILCLVPATARRRAEQNQSLLDQIQGLTGIPAAVWEPPDSPRFKESGTADQSPSWPD